jgi:transcriptional regulator with XRE-family HTH domain
VTAKQFRAARLELGLTQQGLAELLGYATRSVERMEAGTQPIEKVVALAIEALMNRKRVR